MEHQEFVNEGIIRDMSEGILYIAFNGEICSVNPAALSILERERDELLGMSFARCFFEYEENDAFNQMVLDAVYDREKTHEGYVSYYTGKVTKQLRLTTSFLTEKTQKIGIIVVISDITELSELRDAVKAMERIRALNSKLELRNKLLSETFGRFLSDEIVRQLLETPDGLTLGGKKHTITVMMSDLRGFTAMSERMNPQDLITMLNHYLAEMTDVIEAHNGTIIEFLGDGILAIFGAPVFTQTHAGDAVHTAVVMQSRMEAVNEWNKQQGYPILEMGIGINTGETIVGNIGSEKRTKYGVIGSNVNLCGRIESYTVGGQVLISPTTVAQIEESSESLNIIAKMSVFPKGVDHSLELSSVAGIGTDTCPVFSEEPEPLKTPVTVPFSVVEGKHGNDRMTDGTVVALSENTAILQTELALNVYDNLQFDIGAKLFAKVLEKRENGYYLRFTAKPVCFDAWFGEKTH